MPAPRRPKVGKHCPVTVTLTQSTAKRERKAVWKFTPKYQDILQRNTIAEGHSKPLGPYFYQQGDKMFASLPLEMLQGIQNCPHFHHMVKDCESEGIQIHKEIMTQDPRAHFLTPQEYLKKVEAGTMPPTKNHNLLKEMAEKAQDSEAKTQFIMVEFRDFKGLSPPPMPGPQKPQ